MIDLNEVISTNEGNIPPVSNKVLGDPTPTTRRFKINGNTTQTFGVIHVGGLDSPVHN